MKTIFLTISAQILAYLIIFWLFYLTFCINDYLKKDLNIRSIKNIEPVFIFEKASNDSTLYRMNSYTGQTHFFSNIANGWVRISDSILRTEVLSTPEELKAQQKEQDAVDTLELLHKFSH